MPDSLLTLQTLALKYAHMQHEAAHGAQSDPNALRQHIRQTMHRCLPGCIITPFLIEDCLSALRGMQADDDPMYTGAIHAFVGRILLSAKATDDPLLHKLHHSALRFLPKTRPASRDDIRLVTLDALYSPALLPAGIHTAFILHRLGLGSGIPLSCEEIAVRMHQPLVFIHELESAVLTILTSRYSGGHHA